MSFTVIIPARLESSRLPNKVMLPINNKPMIQHVYEQVQMSGADRIIIATDHKSIIDWAHSINAETVLTDPGHKNGTSRIQEAAATLLLDKQTPIIAVQGDEPAINPKLIQQCAEKITSHKHESLTMVTAADTLSSLQDLKDPHTVKVILNDNDEALYFSRSAVGGECAFGHVNSPVMRHIGIYAYYPYFLEQYLSWPTCTLEQGERLEQLKALYHETTMPVVRFFEETGFGVDTQEDYQKMCVYFESQS